MSDFVFPTNPENLVKVCWPVFFADLFFVLWSCIRNIGKYPRYRSHSWYSSHKSTQHNTVLG